MKKINLPYDSNFYKEIMKYRKSNGKKIHYYNSYNNYNNIKCIWNHLSFILWNSNIEIGNYEKKRY